MRFATPFLRTKTDETSPEFINKYHQRSQVFQAGQDPHQNYCTIFLHRYTQRLHSPSSHEQIHFSLLVDWSYNDFLFFLFGFPLSFPSLVDPCIYILNLLIYNSTHISELIHSFPLPPHPSLSSLSVTSCTTIPASSSKLVVSYLSQHLFTLPSIDCVPNLSVNHYLLRTLACV